MVWVVIDSIIAVTKEKVKIKYVDGTEMVVEI